MKLKSFYWFNKNRNDALEYTCKLSMTLYLLGITFFNGWNDYDFTPTFYEILTCRKYEYEVQLFDFKNAFGFEVIQYDVQLTYLNKTTMLTYNYKTKALSNGRHYCLNFKIIRMSWSI